MGLKRPDPGRVKVVVYMVVFLILYSDRKVKNVLLVA